MTDNRTSQAAKTILEGCPKGTVPVEIPSGDLRAVAEKYLRMEEALLRVKYQSVYREEGMEFHEQFDKLLEQIFTTANEAMSFDPIA